MKVAVVFVLLFATVLCRPARKVSDSSSESSEEMARRPAAQPLRRKAAEVPEYRAAPVQNVEEAAAAAGSDESAEGSDEDEQAAAKALVELKSASTDTTSSPDTTSVDSQDSEDSDDDDADDDDAEESETEDEDGESSESGESSSPAPTTVSPVITEEPVAEATAEPIVPTIVTDMETARGDSLGGYPSDYKSIVYVEDKSYHKVPGPYKSYEFVGKGKKMAYDMTEGNEVDKSLKVYKAFQVHTDLLEEDTSTPEMESQGLDAASSISQDQDLSPRQASLPEEEEESATTSESSSAPEAEDEEEEEQSDSTASASTSQESEDEDSQSSEEATATPGAADSESDESAENDEVAAPDATTDMPEVLTAK